MPWLLRELISLNLELHVGVETIYSIIAFENLK